MVPIIRTCSLIVAAAALATGAVPAAAAAAADDLAAYLRARAAEASGDATAAAADYARALAVPPVDAGVAARAYRAGLLAGDEALAARAAAALTALGVAPADAALIPLGRAAAAGDGFAVAAAAAKLDAGPLAMLVPAVAAWVAFADGRGVVDAPAAALDPPARRLLSETRALLLIASGRSGDGIAALTALGGGRTPPLDLRIAAAQLLSDRGEAAAARRLIPGDDPVLARLRDGAAARPTLGFGVSRLLARLGAELSRDETAQVAIALHRAALRADPRNDRARLLLADRLAGEGEPALALATLDAVPAGGAFAPAAGEARIGLLVQTGRPQEALAAARARATAPGAGTGAWEIYAERLAAGGDHAGAATWFARAVASEGARDWTAWARLGNALDEAGRWPEARKALARAVAVAPDQPLALNNLGYAQAVHGERAAGLDLLRRARRMAPGDTSIADSLGWALHLTGDSIAALPLIEAAAADQPGNAEIATHLGDVYWALGRRFEARYAWIAARAVGATGLDARIAR